MTNAIEEIRRIKREGNIGLLELSNKIGTDFDVNKAEEIVYGNPSIDNWDASIMATKLVKSIEEDKQKLRSKINYASEELEKLKSHYDKLNEIDLDI